ncbi:MAG: demethoxyubiquinone hydroxylase family protein [Hyphomicrobiaceae bacterium]
MTPSHATREATNAGNGHFAATRTIARILKVNHAGEHGAIRVYRSQIAIARWRCPEVVPTLEEMLAHEVSHRARFAEVMPSRQAKPCRMLFLWGIGGRLLGGGTALLGRNAIWACTAAIEEAVHRHLTDQIAFLSSRDQELHSLIDSIRVEELSHLDRAEKSLTGKGPIVRVLRGSIDAVTELLILMSTSGDSVRMTREIRLK